MSRTQIKLDIKQVEALAAQGLTHEQIAYSLGVSPATITRRKKESVDFEDAIKRGQSKGIALVTNKLMEQVKSGNTAATIFYLKARAGWKETDRFEHAGTVHHGVIVVPTKDSVGTDA